MDYTCVMLAAGSGKRTGLNYNKVFYKLNDKTVIEHSLNHFINDKDCKQIVLVVSELEIEDFKALNLHEKIEFTFGGKERSDSVYNGLLKVKSDYVIIHDGARPYVSKEIIENTKKALHTNEAVVVMVESVDTVKMVADGYVSKTFKRESLYNAQTPQAFKTDLIINSYKQLKKQNLNATDDAQVVELVSDSKIKIVLGDYANKKITTKEDLM